MSGEVRFVYGFEYEEHADAFLAATLAAGFEAALDARDDGIEAVSVTTAMSAETQLGQLADRFFGHSLGSQPIL